MCKGLAKLFATMGGYAFFLSCFLEDGKTDCILAGVVIEVLAGILLIMSVFEKIEEPPKS